MKLLRASASHCSPCMVWVSAVSHKCRVANTNPPSSKAAAVGMHVSNGGLMGWRSIGISVKQKKRLPAESTMSCQRSCLISESNCSSVSIFATLGHAGLSGQGTHPITAYSDAVLSDKDITDIYAFVASLPGPRSPKDISILNN